MSESFELEALKHSKLNIQNFLTPFTAFVALIGAFRFTQHTLRMTPSTALYNPLQPSTALYSSRLTLQKNQILADSSSPLTRTKTWIYG